MKPTLNVSAVLDNIAQTYEHVKAALDGKLGSTGYHLFEEKYSKQDFGSRCAVWTNTTDSVRLLWDGKDGWFYLQVLESLPIDWRDDWTNLVYIPYDPRRPDFSSGGTNQNIRLFGIGWVSMNC